jgi:hypothetical protein
LQLLVLLCCIDFIDLRYIASMVLAIGRDDDDDAEI